MQRARETCLIPSGWEAVGVTGGQWQFAVVAPGSSRITTDNSEELASCDLQGVKILTEIQVWNELRLKLKMQKSI